MRKRLLVIGMAALLLMAVVPGVAFAKAMFFTADGALVQTDAGGPPGIGAVLPANVVVALIAPADADALLAPFGSDLGIVTIGQEFVGQVDATALPQLRGGALVVNQNSWFDAILFTTTGAINGVAWGTFELNKGNGNQLTGSYAARLKGSVLPVNDAIALGKAPVGTACPATSGGFYLAVTVIFRQRVVSLDRDRSLVEVENGDGV